MKIGETKHPNFNGKFEGFLHFRGKKGAIISKIRKGKKIDEGN